MSRLTGVASAGQGDLFRGDAEAVGSAAFDQEQCLERLDGRARKDFRADDAFAEHE